MDLSPINGVKEQITEDALNNNEHLEENNFHSSNTGQITRKSQNKACGLPDFGCKGNRFSFFLFLYVWVCILNHIMNFNEHTYLYMI